MRVRWVARYILTGQNFSPSVKLRVTTLTEKSTEFKRRQNIVVCKRPITLAVTCSFEEDSVLDSDPVLLSPASRIS
jgi:hypothetical protein